MTTHDVNQILTELAVIKERTKGLPHLVDDVENVKIENAKLQGSVRVLTWALPSGAGLALGALAIMSQSIG